MRLTCPNCDAQYEVDDAVIPPSGRDVQCSNCGHAWFEPGKDGAAGRAAPERRPAPEPELEPETIDISPAEPETEAAVSGSADAGGAAEAEPPPEPAETPAARRSLDDAVLNVLREEAERENRARQAEGSVSVETQADLGLAAAPEASPVPPVTPVREPDDDGWPREAAYDGDEAAAPAEADSKESRRGLLPDIEEINSTLSASSVRPDDDIPPTEEVLTQRRSGFRRGFSVALFLMILLLAVYVLAPNIVQRVPATEPVLRPYVSGIDSLRLWLDEKMRSSTEALRGEDEATG